MQIACVTRAPHAHGHPEPRTIADASLAFHLIADRPFRPLSFGKRGGRVSVAWGISRPGEWRPANLCRFCIRNGEKRIPASEAGVGSIAKPSWRRPGPAQRRPRTRRVSFPRPPRVAHQGIFGENAFCHLTAGAGSIMKPSRPPAPRSRRSNRPRQPPAGRGSAEAAREGGAESPDRAASRRTAPRRADSFFVKNAFPAPASIGFIMGPSRSHSAPGPHTRA